MNRSALLVLAICIFRFASAETCTEIVDDNERLACFDASRACSAIESSSERLKCFETAYSGSDPVNAAAQNPRDSTVVPAEQGLRVGDATETQPSYNVEGSDAAEITMSPKEFANKQTASAKDEELTAIIVEVTTNPHKIDFLRLDNGQIWRENENNDVEFVVGREVRIVEGVFGSFSLTMEGSNKRIKVRRVK